MLLKEFKFLNYGRPLSSDELPRHIEDRYFSFDITYPKYLYGLISLDSRSETCMLQNFMNFNAANNEKGMLFFTAGYTISIIPSSEYIFVHDSHSRNEVGLPDPFGKAILFQFITFIDVVKYLHHAYSFLANNDENQQYEIVFVSVTSSSPKSLNAKNKFLAKQRMRLMRKRKKESSNVKHGNICIKKTYASKFTQNLSKITISDEIHTMLLEDVRRSVDIIVECDSTNQDEQQDPSLDNYVNDQINTGVGFHGIEEYKQCVLKFKDKIKHGPVYICIVCHRTMYKKTVLKFVASKYDSKIVSENLKSVKSFDNC